MKKLRNPILAIVVMLLLNNCGSGEWNISGLYAQKIEASSKILYKYDAWGGRDSHISGYIILDSTENFKVDFQNNLPFTHLLVIPRRNKIIGISTKCDNNCVQNYSKTKPVFTPLRVETFEKENLKIENIIYQYKGFAERKLGLESLHFESFKETRDSLFFYNLDNIESIDGMHLNSLKLRKTEVIISQNADLEVTKIIVENTFADEKTKEILYQRPYFLTPKNKLKSSEFSNYGIFKEVLNQPVKQ